ncbi:MAG: hypothetical protein SCH71_15515 [Desulfobulbaceae bacterium]|nr:hypothetical protein [Desulfobulbaceae bacterium]
MIFDIIKGINTRLDMQGIRSESINILQYDNNNGNRHQILLFIFYKNSVFPKYIARYAKDSKYNYLIKNEYTQYNKLYNKLSSNLKNYLPNPVCIYENSPYTLCYIEEGLPGKNLSNLLKFNKNPKKIMNYIHKAFIFLIEFQHENKVKNYDESKIYNMIYMPLEIYTQRFKPNIKQLNAINYIAKEVNTFCKSSNHSISPCHGDYWISNILYNKDDIYIIDWTNYVESYLNFWDFMTLTFTTSFKEGKLSDNFNEMSDYFLKKINIYPDIKTEIKLFYFMTRSIWNEYLFGYSSKWDKKWNSKFQIELDRYMQ